MPQLKSPWPTWASSSDWKSPAWRGTGRTRRTAARSARSAYSPLPLPSPRRTVWAFIQPVPLMDMGVAIRCPLAGEFDTVIGPTLIF